MKPEERFKYGLMIQMALDGELSDEQFTEFDCLLRENSLFRDYYFELIEVNASLGAIDRFPVHRELSDESCLDKDLWLKLARYEKAAPEAEVPKQENQHETGSEIIYPSQKKRNVSKFNILFLAVNAAAILFIVLFIKFAPPKGGVELATLSDSKNAKWLNYTGSTDKGTRLTDRTGELLLREGLVELLFDNNAKVVLEGPAEFELLAKNQMNLQYGRIYATVPSEAIGFTVNTPTSRIIDLGTEFGVQADTYGDVYLHVIKGKTALLAGNKSSKIEFEVKEGQAKKVSGETTAVTDIPNETGLFVRDISSGKYLWKGELDVDVANIIGRDIMKSQESLICKPGAISQKFWTYFRPDDAPVSLGVGEQLIVTIDFTPRGNLYDNAFRGFRFGLFNDQTNNQILKETNTDSGGDDDPWTDSTGYGVEIALSNGQTESANPYVGKRTDLTEPSLMGSFDAWKFSSGGNNIVNKIDTRYSLRFVLNRIAENQMEVSFTISDGREVVSSHTILDDPLDSGSLGSEPIATDFDQLFLRLSSSDSTADEIEFHRFKIEYSPKHVFNTRHNELIIK